MRTYLRAKIKGIVTGTDLNYEGSLTLGSDFFEQGGFEEGEQVDVVNLNNGARFTTYVIRSPVLQQIVLNGAAARLGQIEDKVIVMAWEIR